MIKWNCPTCGDPNTPKGSHCRSCLCDILCDMEIGTTKEMFKKKRRKNGESK
jgi:hypothetical protein